MSSVATMSFANLIELRLLELNPNKVDCYMKKTHQSITLRNEINFSKTPPINKLCQFKDQNCRVLIVKWLKHIHLVNILDKGMDWKTCYVRRKVSNSIAFNYSKCLSKIFRQLQRQALRLQHHPPQQPLLQL